MYCFLDLFWLTVLELLINLSIYLLCPWVYVIFPLDWSIFLSILCRTINGHKFLKYFLLWIVFLSLLTITDSFAFQYPFFILCTYPCFFRLGIFLPLLCWKYFLCLWSGFLPSSISIIHGFDIFYSVPDFLDVLFLVSFWF